VDWTSSTEPATRRPPIPVKIVIAGGFGVGKTTAVGAISEIDVLTTEAAMTEVAAEIDRTGHTPDKTLTTVALDFGRITLDTAIALYLFGTPGQNRFTFLWDDLAEGALGTVVLADTRRIEDCFPAVTSTSTTSPGVTTVDPVGVPVRITSPGSRVRSRDRSATISPKPNSMSAAGQASWARRPLTQVRSRTAARSTARASMSRGPSGVKPSIPLERTLAPRSA